MNPGDYVRYTAAWLRSGNAARHEVMKLARTLGHVERLGPAGAIEISFPGSKRRNELVHASVLEVVQEGGRHAEETR